VKADSVPPWPSVSNENAPDPVRSWGVFVAGFSNESYLSDALAADEVA